MAAVLVSTGNTSRAWQLAIVSLWQLVICSQDFSSSVIFCSVLLYLVLKSKVCHMILMLEPLAVML